MGGYGTGIRRASGTPRVHSMTFIDLASLKKSKLLRPGVQTKLSWKRNGEPAGDIWFKALHHGIQLEYRTRSGDEEEWLIVDETIRYSYTATNFGGRRRWFVCPSCERRRRILFGGKFYRCRICNHLTYVSQYELCWQRPQSQANKILERLGGKSWADEFPDNPKGMHWRTYKKLCVSYEALENYSIRQKCRKLFPDTDIFQCPLSGGVKQTFHTSIR